MTIKKFVSNSKEGKVIITCDSSGRVIEMADYDLAGHFQRKILYQYDDRGNNTERLVTDEDGKQIRRLTFHYDQENRELGYEEYNAKDELEFRCAFERSDAPHNVRAVWFDKDGKQIRGSFRADPSIENPIF